MDIASLLQRQAGTMRPTTTGPVSPIPPTASVMQPAASAPPSSIREPIIYRAIVAKDAAMRTDIATRRPDLADIANQMASGRSVENRKAIMERELAARFGHDLTRKADARAVLSPYTNFGQGRQG